jgi:hypothetical protein
MNRKSSAIMFVVETLWCVMGIGFGFVLLVNFGKFYNPMIKFWQLIKYSGVILITISLASWAFSLWMFVKSRKLIDEVEDLVHRDDDTDFAQEIEEPVVAGVPKKFLSDADFAEISAKNDDKIQTKSFRLYTTLKARAQSPYDWTCPNCGKKNTHLVCKCSKCSYYL